MKKQFLPYYISRALLSIVFAVFVVGFNWKAIIFAIAAFGFFLLYLHSGWFTIDAQNPLFPIRRDSRGQLIQRKALIIAIVTGLFTYFLLAFISGPLGLASLRGNIALALAIIAYFSSQFLLFSKA